MRLIKNKIKVLIICGLIGLFIVVSLYYKYVINIILHSTQFDILVGVVLSVWINKLIVNHKLNQLLKNETNC